MDRERNFVYSARVSFPYIFERIGDGLGMVCLVYKSPANLKEYLGRDTGVDHFSDLSGSVHLLVARFEFGFHFAVIFKPFLKGDLRGEGFAIAAALCFGSGGCLNVFALMRCGDGEMPCC